MREWAPEVTTDAMTDTGHDAAGAHDAAGTHEAGHDEQGHGHDEHGHAADTLGPIDWTMWSVGLIGVILAAVVAAGFATASGFNFY
jgi:ABC-type Zn2+ transport system substrate-binding protein/surface adhesin